MYNSEWFRLDYNKKKYPQILQFPITNKCNSRCVMCNIYTLDSKNEMTLEDFKEIIQDDIFREIEVVGINGGEPFLYPYLIEIVKELMKKNKLKSLNIISNGFLTDMILEKLKIIYSICKKNKIFFHVSFSLDGYQDVHDAVRGVPGAFEKTMKTIEVIEGNREFYCDTYDLGCTVVRQNVAYLVELDSFLKKRSLPIKYRLGIENERLYNKEKTVSYSVLEDFESKQAAIEFFYSQIYKESSIYGKFKYYAIFSYLADQAPRKLGCDWRTRGVTLDSRGHVYYCAVKSPCIANLKLENGKVFFSKNSLEIKSRIIEKECMHCIHDYYGKPKLKDVLQFVKFYYLGNGWIKKFRG